MKKPVNQFFLGFRAITRGISLIRKEPKILKLAIIPFIIDVLIVSAVFVWGSGQISGWVESGLQSTLPELSGFFWSILYGVFYILAWIVFIAALFFGGYVLAGIVAAPFNSLLAEKTLEQTGALPKEPFNFKRWLSLSAKMLWAALIKAGVFLFLGLVLLAISFIPAVGVIGSFGMLMIMSFDMSDFAFESLGLKFSERMRFFRQNFLCFAGVSAALGLTLLVPGLNVLLLPAAVVGSSEMVSRLHGPKKTLANAEAGLAEKK